MAPSMPVSVLNALVHATTRSRSSSVANRASPIARRYRLDPLQLVDALAFSRGRAPVGQLRPAAGERGRSRGVTDHAGQSGNLLEHRVGHEPRIRTCHRHDAGEECRRRLPRVAPDFAGIFGPPIPAVHRRRHPLVQDRQGDVVSNGIGHEEARDRPQGVCWFRRRVNRRHRRAHIRSRNARCAASRQLSGKNRASAACTCASAPTK